jgi:F-type H+-transporting ATPase subunit gamma
MASLKEMRNRIASVKATQKITKAMQMVAAAKLRRSQDAAEGARPYAQRLASVIANLAAGVSGDAAPKMLAGTGSDQRQLVIVATSDRGLAGGFNGNVVRAARDHINSLIAAGKTVSIITVGKKSVPVMKRLFGDRIVASFDAGAKPSLDGALAIAAEVTSRFEAGEFDVISLY